MEDFNKFLQGGFYYNFPPQLTKTKANYVCSRQSDLRVAGTCYIQVSSRECPGSSARPSLVRGPAHAGGIMLTLSSSQSENLNL